MNRPLRPPFRLPALALSASLLLAGCGGSGGSSTPAPTPGAPPPGTYGGSGSAPNTPAALRLTATGGTLTLACGNSDVLTQPLVVDAGGNFDVPAAAQIALPYEGPPLPIHLVGTRRGSTLTVSEKSADGTLSAPYTLVYGQQPPAFTGLCPG